MLTRIRACSRLRRKLSNVGLNVQWVRDLIVVAEQRRFRSHCSPSLSMQSDHGASTKGQRSLSTRDFRNVGLRTGQRFRQTDTCRSTNPAMRCGPTPNSDRVRRFWRLGESPRLGLSRYETPQQQACWPCRSTTRRRDPQGGMVVAAVSSTARMHTWEKRCPGQNASPCQKVCAHVNTHGAHECDR